MRPGIHVVTNRPNETTQLPSPQTTTSGLETVPAIFVPVTRNRRNSQTITDNGSLRRWDKMSNTRADADDAPHLKTFSRQQITTRDLKRRDIFTPNAATARGQVFWMESCMQTRRTRHGIFPSLVKAHTIPLHHHKLLPAVSTCIPATSVPNNATHNQWCVQNQGDVAKGPNPDPQQWRLPDGRVWF